MKKADLILSSDIHLRDDSPVCRVDDFRETQRKKLVWCSQLSDAHGNPPWLNAGDLFHWWKSSPGLISMANEYLPPNFVTVPGNHELPEHRLARLLDSSLYTAWTSEAVVIPLSSCQSPSKLDANPYEVLLPISGKKASITAFAFDEDITPCSTMSTINIALAHIMCYKGRAPFPGASGGVKTLLKKFKGYDLIITGDNHKPFTFCENGQLWVNPGSLMRQRTSETHAPRVYLYYADEHKVTKEYVPIDPKAVSTDHIGPNGITDDDIQIFIERLSEEFDLDVDFKDYLLQVMKAEKTPQELKDKVMSFTKG